MLLQHAMLKLVQSMKLPGLSFLKKQAPKEYFLALLLEEEYIRSVVFEETDGVMHLLGQGKESLPAPLDDSSYEELLTAADKAIAEAETSLPEGVESHKTIFGVKSDWTENLQIKKEHLATLKKLCDELDLQPIGFLVFAEAIAHLLQKQEGAPVSGILLDLGEKRMSATLLRAGRVIGSLQTSMEEPLPTTVDKLLSKFSEIEILPSRILLLDREKRAQYTKQLSNHTWSKQLPFLHVPQVTALPDGFETQAILYGTATQMGFAIADMPLAVKKPMNPLPEMEEAQPEEDTSAKFPEPMEEENDVTLADAVEPDEVITEPVTDEETRETNISEKIDKDQTPPSGDNFGFVKDADVLESVPKHPKTFSPVSTPDNESLDVFAEETFADIPEEVKEDEERATLPGIGSQAVMITEGMKKVLGKLKNIKGENILSSFSGIFGGNSSFRPIFLLIPLVVIILIGGLLWYFLGLKATATLLINPKTVEASQTVTFSSTGSTNIDNNIIGGNIVPMQEDGKVSTNATGKKNVGDKAKGTVTIYNNDDSSHTLPAGTTLTSANGLKFVTNNDATIASASGDIFSGTQPGTKDVDVTAADIGTDYNLPSGTKFAIGSSTVIAAKNGSAFSGGTQKSVTVVQQSDLDTLTKNLTDTLFSKAKQDLASHIGSDQTVLPVFLSTDFSNKQFDHIVGDQVSTVNLSATISYSALSYADGDVKQLAQKVIQSQNQNDNITPDNLSVDIKNPTVSKDGKSVSATLDIKANLLPQVDTKAVAEKLAGKSFTDAVNVLSDVPQLVSVKAVLSPNLFFLPHIFPHMASHITVGVASNE